MKLYRAALSAAMVLSSIAATPYTQAESFANPAFETTWARTDKPVADGSVKRSFFWGPVPDASFTEPYAEGVGGKRLVQYFDKSRMEINNPSADPASPFYVTNGLLTVELLTGKVQTGNNLFTDRYPAQIPLASDTDDITAPTYASFAGLLGKAENHTGKVVAQRIDRAGHVTPDTGSAFQTEQTIAYYEPATGHNVPRVFWDFLNLSGYVVSGGKVITARLSDPWFYASGFPVSEPYWADVKIAGKPGVRVYVQAYQRRVLTFVPALPAGFQVQMGNIGQHYYDWRYKDAGKEQILSTPTAPAQNSGGVLFTGEVRTSETLDADALAAKPCQTISVTFKGADGSTEGHTYKGPLLLDLLKEIGGNGNSGRDLPVRYIVATGQGGKRVVLSWGEIEPFFAGTRAIVAYQQDAANLTGAQGPARLVIPSDRGGARSLYGLSKIEVRAVPANSTTGNLLKITGAVAKPLSLSTADLTSRNPVTIPVGYEAGEQHVSYTYTGVPVLQLLNEAEVQGDPLTRIVVAAENDGRQAVFSWGEIDPSLSGVSILAAQAVDGVRLDIPRLVVPSDARGGRYLPYLSSLDVREVAP